MDMKLSQRGRTPGRITVAKNEYDTAKKAVVPLEIFGHTIDVRAAVVSQEKLEKLYKGERFAVVISGEERTFIFFNKELPVPPAVVSFIPKLMAIHCIAHLFANDNMERSERGYYPIRLELAYAKRLLDPEVYVVYEKWRETVERSDFFNKCERFSMIARTCMDLPEIERELFIFAHNANFLLKDSTKSLKRPPPAKTETQRKKTGKSNVQR
jgi:hypothetical protein